MHVHEPKAKVGVPELFPIGFHGPKGVVVPARHNRLRMPLRGHVVVEMRDHGQIADSH